VGPYVPAGKLNMIIFSLNQTHLVAATLHCSAGNGGFQAMRVLIYGVVAASLAAGACNRAEPVASNLTTQASTSADTSGSAPVATAGRTSSAAVERATDPVVDPRSSDWREITIPAGTRLPIILETAVASDTSRVEQAVQAHIARAVSVQGVTVLPAGSRVSGVVTDATRSGKVKGRAHVGLRFDTLVPQGADERYTIHTAAVGRTAPATKKKDALKIGAPAAGGAIVGAILGGKKGAAIGTAVGGGAGTAVVLETRGQEVRLGQGAAFTLQLSEPVTVRVRAKS
jgi:hypothetical protein